MDTVFVTGMKALADGTQTLYNLAITSGIKQLVDGPRFLDFLGTNCQRLQLGEKRLYVTDTSMRDAQQSPIATRMRTKGDIGARQRPPT